MDVERREARCFALLFEFGHHRLFEHVAGDLLAQVALGGGLVATWDREAIAPLPLSLIHISEPTRPY